MIRKKMVTLQTLSLVATIILQLFANNVMSSGLDRKFGIDYDNNTFVKDGTPFRYISGSIHYARVHYQYWDDRLSKMAAAGLNAIQTYVPWNIHEPKQGDFNFEQQQDIVTFLKTAQKYNLSVILRPGPYICAEWEFGGLPGWLLRYNPYIEVRTMDPNYIGPVDSWFTKLFTVIKPLLYKNGGPIITIQIENEYGSYPACDYTYLRFLANKTRSMLGDDVVLFTTDGDGDGYLKCGTLPDVYATIDFGVTFSPEKNFEVQRHVEPKGPLVNSEYYTGWLDHWGENHSTTPAELVAKSLDLQLALGANVNMYMFEGGTNFGFWNGANYPYQPVPTSYDYDAPLTEAGDITDKYMALRAVISKYNPLPDVKIPPNTPKAAYGNVTVYNAFSAVSWAISKMPFPSAVSEYPVSMEDCQFYYGFMVYKTPLKPKYQDVINGTLDLSAVRDRGYVYIGNDTYQTLVGIVERDSGQTNITITAQSVDNLYIMVENQGRINYGGQMNDNRKGLISNITLNGAIVRTWSTYPLVVEEILQTIHPMDVLVSMTSADEKHRDAIYIGYFDINDEPMDTYIDMSNFTKGQVLINDFNVGRYWPHKGPQVRLYVPKYFLIRGRNIVVLVELETSLCVDVKSCIVKFVDVPYINATIPPSVHSNNNQRTSIWWRILEFVVWILDRKWTFLIL